MRWAVGLPPSSSAVTTTFSLLATEPMPPSSPWTMVSPFTTYRWVNPSELLSVIDDLVTSVTSPRGNSLVWVPLSSVATTHSPCSACPEPANQPGPNPGPPHQPWVRPGIVGASDRFGDAGRGRGVAVAGGSGPADYPQRDRSGDAEWDEDPPRNRAAAGRIGSPGSGRAARVTYRAWVFAHGPSGHTTMVGTVPVPVVARRRLCRYSMRVSQGAPAARPAGVQTSSYWAKSACRRDRAVGHRYPVPRAVATSSGFCRRAFREQIG